MGKKLSLAQFKRDAATGKMGLQLLKRYGKKVEDTSVVPVIQVLSQSIKLQRGDKESFLDIPYASLVDYTGEFLYVYSIGSRPLNQKEQAVMDAWNRVASTKEYIERAEYDAISDGSSTYYQKKRFFLNSSCPYLFEDKPNLRYNYNKNEVYDAKVKGDCILKYRVYIAN